jgi:hypothetical protein
MIRHYTFDYDVLEAEACFKVDTEKFTNEHANTTLEFFIWDYDKEADPIDEVMKKYAIEAIRIATFNGYNEIGVIEEFNDTEGYCKVDGSSGITLNSISEYTFDSAKLDMTVVTDKDDGKEEVR